MNIIGKWKLKGMNIPAANGPVFYTEDNFPEEYVDVFNENKDMLLEFCEDGTLNTIVEATDSYLEMAAAEGIVPREDGFIVVDTVKWEDRDGKIFYDSQAEGTILDEPVDPFVSIDVTEDGDIWFNFGMALYERV